MTERTRDRLNVAMSEDEEAAIEQVLEGLEDLLSRQAVRQGVQAFLDTLQVQVADVATGSPASLFRLSAKDRSLLTDLIRAYSPTVTASEDEVTTARSEIIRYWANAVFNAWRTLKLDQAGRLALGSELLPVRQGSDPDYARFLSWEKRRQESLRSLWASVALSGDQMPKIFEEFRHAVQLRLSSTSSSIAFPYGLALWSNNAGKSIYLVRR